MDSRQGTQMAAVLAIFLVVYGVLAIFTHRDESTRSWLLWVASLLGSATIVVAGLVVRRYHLHVGTALLVVGSVLAVIPTMWTVIMPVLELTVAGLALRDHSKADQLV
jgi:biotin transporter BioY